MSASIRSFAIEDIIQSLDVPDTAYKEAERRYEDIGEWLHNYAKANSAPFSPHVFSQGSFRLGTVTRPWKRDDYDLDLCCKLQDGLSKSECTQKQIKHLLGSDLKKYRQERDIQEPPKEKHRCWRLNYQDALQFHIDIVPAIPERDDDRQILFERMVKTGTDEVLARDVVQHAVAITDNRDSHYSSITPVWPISNQEGYAIWFESRMRQAQQLLESRAAMEKEARIDDLPVYRWKTPLQQCIQILKRHRDMMFETDQDGKPISVIITTLAARAYQGETDIEAALITVLDNMGELVNSTVPRVPNPVNTQEDFADKWPLDPTLEPNFRRWLVQAQEDFRNLGCSDDIQLLAETAMQKFGARVDKSRLSRADGLLRKATSIIVGTAHTSQKGTIGESGVKNLPHEFYG